MMQYIHDHYMEEITLETIAAYGIYQQKLELLTHFFENWHPTVTTGSISNSIQTSTGCCNNFISLQKSVSSIAEETGFTSSGYF